MAVLFPDIPQAVDSTEIHSNHLFDHLTACVKLGQTPGELCYPHGVAIDSNTRRIYVAEGIYHGKGNPMSIARVSFFSESGEFLDTFSHQRMKWPYGIAIHRDNMYVTDIKEHCVFHFKVEAHFRLVAKLGGRGSGIGQFNEPRQLAVSNNGDIFVTDCNNNRVKILDSNLHHQLHISHHSMALPLDVKLTPDEVYILCQTTPCVKVFSYTGDLMRSLITRGDIGMEVFIPTFFCLDANRNLLLSDCLDHQIKVFSKEGTLLHNLGEPGHKVGMFYYPHGIAFTYNLKLVIVSNNINYSLQIFSSDY